MQLFMLQNQLHAFLRPSAFTTSVKSVLCCMARRRLNRIKIVLAEQDRSSSWLAEALDKNKSTVSRWCSNIIQPRVETLFEIAAVLEVDVRELLVSTGERK